MDIATIRAFFLSCTVINGALLVLSFLICAFAGEWVYRMHSRWFPICRESFNVAIYCFLGLFKMFVLGFNLAPYIAFVIVG